jgi:alpha-glucosidase
MLLTLRGTPFVYQGEELGLENAVITPETQVDPGGRDGSRAPLPWLAQPPHGWSGKPPWLPFPPDAEALSVQRAADDPESILQLYRRLIVHRRQSPALGVGDWTELPSPPEVLAYLRRAGNDKRAVAINFADHPLQFDVDGDWRVAVASDHQADGERFTGRLLGEQAVLLEPVSP